MIYHTSSQFSQTNPHLVKTQAIHIEFDIFIEYAFFYSTLMLLIPKPCCQETCCFYFHVRLSRASICLWFFAYFQKQSLRHSQSINQQHTNWFAIPTCYCETCLHANTYMYTHFMWILVLVGCYVLVICRIYLIRLNSNAEKSSNW